MASPSFSTSPIGFNTQPPEGGWPRAFKDNIYFSDVSTHSRLKAAGPSDAMNLAYIAGFNTQPPEGGW